eukprot:TRINITY_DN64989_c0_g1_i1.p1 TRINITY_DN64989_c0_g1~~TRINITY_DN64989_c0_g1_i1.p1  ORF type:complete len:512 (-),score=140.39 TRINITY_DN64989_c0_g1_i1:73-1503(-)
MALLLQHRDDAKVEDLARICAALRDLAPQPSDIATEVHAGLELLAEALLLRELSELSPAQIVNVLHCYVVWGLCNKERKTASTASMDLCWALARELKGLLRDLGKENPKDLATLALALSTGGIAHEELWEELSKNIELEAYRMTGPVAASAVYGAARGGHRGYKLYENLARRLEEEAGKLEALDCARAAGAFLRGPGGMAEKVVLRGPVGERILELGFGAFDAEALTMLLDALVRARPSVWGVEAMAGGVLEALEPRLGELSAQQLASAARCLGHLQPESPEVLRAVLDRAQAAIVPSKDAEEEKGVSPRYVAMLCQGISMQPARKLPDAGKRLKNLLPQVNAAISAKPTATTAAQLLGSLARCEPCEERTAALDVCAARLAAKAHELQAHMLVNLAGSIATVSKSGWTISPELLKEVSRQLDMKRYDLPQGVLWRAVDALEAVGVSREQLPTLEARDLREVAKKPRRKGSIRENE